MWPRLGSSKLITRWLVVVIAASIVSTLDGGWLASVAALEPAKIWRGQLWRLVTWPLIEQGPLALVFACVAIFKLAGDLAIRWGERRLRRFVLQIIVGAAVVTTLLATLTGMSYLRRLGGWAISEALLIAWARQFPNEVLVVYGLLKLSGRELVWLTVGTAVLLAIFISPIVMAPELTACVAAAAYPQGWLRRM
jgi:membrane associated rhomboid family serine protease